MDRRREALALAAAAAITSASGPARAARIEAGREASLQGPGRSQAAVGGSGQSPIELKADVLDEPRPGTLDLAAPPQPDKIMEGLGPPKSLLEPAALPVPNFAEPRLEAASPVEGRQEKEGSEGLISRIFSNDDLSPGDARDAVVSAPAAFELHHLKEGGSEVSRRVYENAVADGVPAEAATEVEAVPVARDWALSGHRGEKNFLRLMRSAARPTLRAMNEERGVSGIRGLLRPWRRASFAQALREGLRPAEILLRALSGAGVFSEPLSEWSARHPAFNRERRPEIMEALLKINSALAAIQAEAPAGSRLARLRLPRIPFDEGVLEFLPVDVLEQSGDTESLNSKSRERARESLRHAGAFHWDGKVFILSEVLQAATDRQVAAIILHEWLAMNTGLPHQERKAGGLDVTGLMAKITSRAFRAPVTDAELRRLLERLGSPPEPDRAPRSLHDPETYTNAAGLVLSVGAPLLGVASFLTGFWPAAGWVALVITGALVGIGGYKVAHLAAGYKSRGGVLLEEVLVGLAGLFFALAAIIAGFLLSVYAGVQLLQRFLGP